MSSELKIISNLDFTLQKIVGRPGYSAARNGESKTAMFMGIQGMTLTKDNDVLVTDAFMNCLRLIDNELTHVQTLRFTFDYPRGITTTRDGVVFVTSNDEFRRISPDLEKLHRLPNVRSQQKRSYNEGLVVTPNGNILFSDTAAHKIYEIENDDPHKITYHTQPLELLDEDKAKKEEEKKASLSQDDEEYDYYDDFEDYFEGLPFFKPRGLAALPDGRVLVADSERNIIRCISSDLKTVRTVAGNGEKGHKDGKSANAMFNFPRNLVVLPDGQVLVAEENGVRVLSKNLEDVSTLSVTGMPSPRAKLETDKPFFPTAMLVMHDGRVLVADQSCIYVLQPKYLLHNLPFFGSDQIELYPFHRLRF